MTDIHVLAAPPPPIRVFIAASFEPIRVGLRDGIAGAGGGIEVVGDSRSIAEMLAHPGFLRSDVLIVDVGLLRSAGTIRRPDLPGLIPSLKVLFIGSPAEAAEISANTLRWVIKLNTVGFLYRDGTTDRMVEAIKLMASGAFVCEGDAMKTLLTLVIEGAARGSPRQAYDDALTEREADVLRLVAQGLSNREIAARLFLSEGTIKAHVSHIMTKLGLERRTELVRYAMSRGLDAAA